MAKSSVGALRLSDSAAVEAAWRSSLARGVRHNRIGVFRRDYIGLPEGLQCVSRAPS